MLRNIFDIFVYSALYVFILVLGTKVIGTVFSPDFERRISQNGNIGLSILLSSFFIAMAIVFSSVIR
jgi:hypothetical protein